jgi:3',5'-cyclic AMP phosphodiesterase CpdA
MDNNKNAEPALRIYWITDLHFKDAVTGQPDAEGAIHRERHYYAAKQKMVQAVEHMNRDKPELVICTGDINDGKQPFDSFMELWDRIEADKRIVIGNHDTPNGYASIVQQLGCSRLPSVAGSVFNHSLVLSKDGLRVKVILLDTNIGDDGVHLNGGVQGTIQPEALHWLEQELSEGNEELVLLFTHNGLGGPASYFNQQHVQRFVEMVESAAEDKQSLQVINLAGHHHVHPVAVEKHISPHIRFINGVAMIAGETSSVNVVEIYKDGSFGLTYKEVGYWR